MDLILEFRKEGLTKMLGLIILRFDPIILKGRIVLNVDVSGLDPVSLKGRIVQDVGTNHP